ncbi:iron complex transport system permease protein [Pseudonocardia ammonioxydans]|uniref:Iron complex transport system permease protein n=1 Tax=Pseudonocardia ammonioxydans TaxID=260086 RepID=A0A1I4VQ36_PSUAM|nr:iron chelate uptake ABC transporter family permease subunit [Pseudonocardia ammonioxydans]SFN03139.1 iron complex transport system permease protein [Pseudonocardia ammonioxydans]
MSTGLDTEPPGGGTSGSGSSGSGSAGAGSSGSAALVPGRRPLRVRDASMVLRVRPVVVFAVCVVVLVLAAAVNLGRGDYPIAITDVLATLFGGGDAGQQLVVLDLRLPRTLVGALVGAALAVSGGIFQAIARNPLASPDIIGIQAGASASAVFVIVLGGGVAGVGGMFAALGIPLAALAGGLVSATVIYALAWRRGIQGFRLVLVGIGINAVLIAAVNWLLTVAQVYQAAQAQVWLNGSLNARSWNEVLPLSVTMIVLVPAALVLVHVLGALRYDDDTARGLGVRVNLSRTLLLLVAVGLASVATAAAGPIAFVALVTPQIAQRLCGTGTPPLAVSMVLGAAMTVVADVIARTALGSVELPVGIITAVLGAPYLLYLLARSRQEARA